MDMNLAPYIRAYLGMMKELGVSAVTPGGVQLNTTRDVVDNAPRRYGRVNRLCIRARPAACHTAGAMLQDSLVQAGS